MQPIECWRPVVGYEGLYEVSDQGRVRSLARVVPFGNRARALPERMLNPSLSPPYPYFRVGPSKAGKQRHICVHVLVAAAFIGPRPKGLEVRHLNGTQTDNRASNLRYGTKSQNRQDSVQHGTHIYASRSACIRGHEYTPETSFWRTRRGSTERVCRICEEIREARRSRRRKS